MGMVVPCGDGAKRARLGGWLSVRRYMGFGKPRGERTFLEGESHGTDIECRDPED